MLLCFTICDWRGIGRGRCKDKDLEATLVSVLIVSRGTKDQLVSGTVVSVHNINNRIGTSVLRSNRVIRLHLRERPTTLL